MQNYEIFIGRNDGMIFKNSRSIRPALLLDLLESLRRQILSPSRLVVTLWQRGAWFSRRFNFKFWIALKSVDELFGNRRATIGQNDNIISNRKCYQPSVLHNIWWCSSCTIIINLCALFRQPMVKIIYWLWKKRHLLLIWVRM